MLRTKNSRSWFVAITIALTFLLGICALAGTGHAVKGGFWPNSLHALGIIGLIFAVLIGIILLIAIFAVVGEAVEKWVNRGDDLSAKEKVVADIKNAVVRE